MYVINCVILIVGKTKLVSELPYSIYSNYNKADHTEQMMLSILSLKPRDIVCFYKWILGKKTQPYATTSNYCNLSSFGNAMLFLMAC